MTRVADHMKKSFEKHEMKVLHSSSLDPFDAKVLVVEMKQPGTRNMKVQVTFTPEGIAIQGDVGLGETQRGLCSATGYGLAWWVGQLSEDYLAEKFLHTKWTKERAIEDLEYMREQLREELKDAEVVKPEEESALGDAGKERDKLIATLSRKIAALDEMIPGVDDGQVDARQLYDDLCDADLGSDDGTPGWGYCPTDMGWLAAIQQAFKRLWDEWQTKKLDGKPAAEPA